MEFYVADVIRQDLNFVLRAIVVFHLLVKSRLVLWRRVSARRHFKGAEIHPHMPVVAHILQVLCQSRRKCIPI
jgi:hypothetical protein